MYIYELHQHTAACSKCAKADTRKVINRIKELGFTGVCLTNHFYRGNTCINRDLSWKDFCGAYAQDYYIAKNEGEKIGLDVFFGLEEEVGYGKEALIYGLLPENIISHPELRDGDLSLISKVVRDEGGVIIQAHPYRGMCDNKKEVILLPPEYLDGYEGYNFDNTEKENALAVKLAVDTGKLITAGSDSHEDQPTRRNGISTLYKIKDEKDLARVIRNREYSLYISVK